MNLIEAGVVWTSPSRCSPLDEITVEYEWRGLHGQPVHLEVSDAAHHPYLTGTFTSQNGKAQTTFRAGGAAGVHHVQLWTVGPDGREYRRHGCFRMDVQTSIRTDHAVTNELFGYLRDGLSQTLDISIVDGKPITHYKAADNTRQNMAYPVYAIGALRYFIRDVKSMFEALFSYQYPDGSLPDHIYSDDYPCPRTSRRLRSCMADLEIGAAVTLCSGWQAHGDGQWMDSMLPKVEKSMEYVITDPVTFDLKHGVIKRPHTLDEWDIHFTPQGQQGNMINDKSLYVIMQGDTACMYDACRSLAQAYQQLHNDRRANHWLRMRDHFRRIGNELFWDGIKYRHHIHLDPFDHGDFNEEDQLTLSSAWAITRGFADHKQSVSILKEYLRRWNETGDRFPWWSLQPGYPDELKYFEPVEPWRSTQGYYANGGLFPLVGGELCRGAFQHGMEEVAVTLLADLHFVFKRDRGALFTWYDRQGNAAINAPHNQTNHDAWGLSPWTQAVIEELAGIRSAGKCFEQVSCAPRWPAMSCHNADATAHFPASDSYFSYRYVLSDRRITLSFTGTGVHASFRILLPSGRTCTGVNVDGKPVSFDHQMVEQSEYVVFDLPIRGCREVICDFQGVCHSLQADEPPGAPQ
ncbi:MAG: hypothetical protein IT446_10125 [Phycisphaerales bacterium]|nr:hypothetical protein [Phycisphaerales bacterium]